MIQYFCDLCIGDLFLVYNISDDGVYIPEKNAHRKKKGLYFNSRNVFTGKLEHIKRKTPIKFL